jgi:hypothetical protein
MVKVRQFAAEGSWCIVWRESGQYRLQLDLRLLPTVFDSAREAEAFGRQHARNIRGLDDERMLVGLGPQVQRALSAIV